MGVDLHATGVDVSNKISSMLAPVVSNPLITAVLITILLVVIILLTYSGDGKSIAKVAFWSLAAVTIIVFFHDHVVINSERTNVTHRNIQMASYETPSGLLSSPEVVMGQYENKKKSSINIPVLSVERYGTGQGTHRENIMY